MLFAEISTEALDAVNSIIFGSHGVWFLIGASLVFFMQAGFAMVEAGFTRAKNAGNIIMKNTMDFAVKSSLREAPHAISAANVRFEYALPI